MPLRVAPLRCLRRSTAFAWAASIRVGAGGEWYVNRDELDLAGQDERLVERLSEKMRTSRAQTPSLEHRELADPEWGSEFTRVIAPSRNRLPGLGRAIDRDTARDQSRGRSR